MCAVEIIERGKDRYVSSSGDSSAASSVRGPVREIHEFRLGFASGEDTQVNRPGDPHKDSLFRGNGMKVCASFGDAGCPASGGRQQVNDSGSVLVLRVMMWSYWPTGTVVLRRLDVTGSRWWSNMKWFFIGAKVVSFFSLSLSLTVCAMLANVSSLTNHTSSEAVSIIKQPACCTCTVGWVYFLKG